MPLRKQGPGGHTFEQADQKCEQRDIDQLEGVPCGQRDIDQLEGVACEHRDIGEPDVKGEKEMATQPEVKSMLMMFERMLQEQRTMTELGAAIDRLIQNNGQFDGRDVSHYMRDYKAEMVRCGVSEALRISTFSRIATDDLQEKIQELRKANTTWATFERAVLNAFAMDDSTKETRRGFEEWVDLPHKGMKVLDVLCEFESKFNRLSTRDQTVLQAEKVIMFLRAVDIRDRKDLGVLMENTTTDSGLVETWAEVKEIVTRYNKRRQWLGEDERKGDKTPRRMESTSSSSRGSRSQELKAEKTLDPTTLDQLAKSLEDLKIAFVKKDEEMKADSRFKDRRCIWCDSTDHGRGDCEEHKEALRRDLIYYEGNRIHSTETRQPLKTNFRKGGMKKVLQEEREGRINYSASAGIRVGESCATQITFWPEVLETFNDNCLTNTKPVVQEVQRSTGWECPVDDTTTHALCQMHEVSVEEKRKRPDESVGPSKRYDTRSTSRQEEKKIGLEKGKEKLSPAYKLASDIEQQIDLKKLLEERVLDSRMEFSLRELLGIAKKEFHELIIDLVKRKRHVLEEAGHPKVNTNTIFMSDVDNFDVPDSHYANKHWARATTETPVRIGNVKEPVIALIDHGSEINLMSRDFYKKGKWPINTNHGWRIRAATKATEDLYGACPDVPVKIGDVQTEQNFFVQEGASHEVILGQPFITSSRMETKVLDTGAAFARIWSEDGGKSIQFLTVPSNHERNKRELSTKSKVDF